MITKQQIFTKMTRIFIILFLLSLNNFIFSQNISKAYKYIGSGELDKAMKILKKAVEKKKEPIATKYGMALVYLNEEYDKTSYLKSYKYMKYAEKKLKKSNTKSTIEKKYNISDKSINDYKNIISRKAFGKLKNKKSVEEINRFLKIYDCCNFSKSIEYKRDSIEFYKLDDKKDFREYQNFVIKYPQSDFKKKTEKKIEKLWKQLYEEAASYGEYEILNNFQIKYPDYPYYSSYTEKNKKIANMACSINLEKKYKTKNEKKYKEYIKAAAPKELAYVVLLRLIEPVLYKKNYKKAIKILNEYKVYFGNKYKKINQLINILEAPTNNIKTLGISNKINTKAWEYSASITANGKQIYFCGRYRPDNLILEKEDIFTSIYENNKWSKPVPVKGINTANYHESPVSISGNGNRMLLYSSSNIYYTDKKQNGWTTKLRLPGINKNESWEADAMQTYDGNAVLFISDRKGNVGHHHKYSQKFHGRTSGNTDIYVSVKKGTNSSKLINLGTVINTPFTERSPFLHSDMRTLYFSSDGHAGLGNLDVFMSKRLSDTSWTQWSEPVNLGKEINTSEDEYDYEISTDGKIAYFSSFKNNNFDIFMVQLPKELQPETVTTISGTIKNKDGKPLYATINWENLETGELIGYSKSNPDDGSYIIVLPNGKNYGYFVELNKFYPASGNINLSDKEEMLDIKRNINLISEDNIINNNIPIRLENLFFDNNKYLLEPESYPELNRLIKFLKKYNKLNIEISGHTDNTGTEELNKILSLNRAKSLKKYLEEKNCNTKRLTAKGYGQNKPVATNNTKEGRAKNRRVEFRIKK